MDRFIFRFVPIWIHRSGFRSSFRETFQIYKKNSIEYIFE